MQELSEISEQEKERIRTYLTGLARTLQGKKGIGSRGNLISEEETVLNAIQAPNRGDLKVLVIKNGKSSDIFIQNPRESDNPFAIMNARDHGQNPGRRRLNTSDAELKEDEFALFLGTAQDREVIRSGRDQIINAFTAVFEVSDKRQEAETDKNQDLRNKPLETCNLDEKWTIYISNWDFDTRKDQIVQELFLVPLMFAKYKQSVKQENLNLEPEKYRSSINQMIRDIYPANLRSVLKTDFKKEHADKLKEVQDCLKSLRNRIGEKIAGAGTGEYSMFLKTCDAYVTTILEKDPELTRV